MRSSILIALALCVPTSCTGDVSPQLDQEEIQLTDDQIGLPSDDDGRPIPEKLSRKDSTIFLAPEEYVDPDTYMLYKNGYPVGIGFDGTCCEGVWNYPVRFDYPLTCENDQTGVLSFRRGESYQPFSPLTKAEFAELDKGFEVYFDKAIIGSYAVEAAADSDGIYRLPKKLYALSDFFSGATAVHLKAYNCSGGDFTTWIVVERELHISNGDLLAFSREHYSMVRSGDNEFVWLRASNTQSEQYKVQKTRNKLYDGNAPSECSLDVWPCEDDDRQDRVKAMIEDRRINKN